MGFSVILLFFLPDPATADFCSQLRNTNNQGGQVLITLFHSRDDD
jgi:hypothetical protein